MTLPASGTITWSQICTEFSLNPVTAVWPTNFYGKGGAPSSGALSFSDFYGRSAGGAFTPVAGTYTYTDNNTTSGTAGAGVTVTASVSQTWTWSSTGSTSLTGSLASGGSGTSIAFNLPASTGTTNRTATVTLTAAGNTWNLTLNATGTSNAGGGTCVSVNSLILMADGTEKRAGDLVPGDIVRTRHELTGEWGNCEVSNVSFAYEPVYSRRDYPDATKRHRFGFLLFGKPRWFRASWLGRRYSMAMVAKITVTGAHTYMARNPNSAKWRLSHNLKP